MSKNIKVFDTLSEYQAYTGSSEYVSPNFSYVKSEDETYYDGNEKRYYSNWMDVVPKTQDTVFQNMRTYISAVDVPDTVTSLAANCMAQSKVVDIELPSGVTTVGYQSFLDCTKLESITMPDDVATFGYSVFAGCSKLKRMNSSTDGVVNFPTGLTTVGSATCRNCSSIVEVNVPGTLLNTGTHMFSACTSLTTANFESGTTTIGVCCFQNCTSMQEITLPDTVTTIGNDAFAGCSKLKRMNSNTDGIINLPSGLTSVGSGICRVCTSITEVNIPGTLANTGTHAFSGCTNLTTANFETGTTTIGTNCFQGCTKLTTVNLPDGLHAVNNASFQGCTSLSSITIPTSVTTVGSAFYGCNKLKSCEIPSGAVTTYVNTFYGCSQLSSLTINSPITAITSGYCQGCTVLKRLNSDTDGVYNIPSTVVRFGKNCFHGNKALVELNIPDSTIGEISTAHTAWFSGCSALNKVDIGTGLTKIAASGFCVCGTIQSFTIRRPTPPTIGTNAFKSTTLANIYVPYDVVDTYKAASGWSTYAAKIQAIPETIPDSP